ncbi:uncharacterized protein LACBIDRAFT_329575 [Laccaria bicolor S238N-H82]|uniref:Predicted protein n=1 Tax=Laccaria bicolor (strain S238N-H82 / ATCC MYA-4686) TaxID=486041 RepID=B0DIG4_LACBS|nr:uncharacterized protein LACBIDRAFT_329575 [Laccaria bicolor S238N-H82]EDR05562.1 predicted protein [Laccaria bicolor S238N-H82]|eukprot:XP_001883666.1 predicted protein [Laccaria bicolor S238N-H82]
MGESKLDDVNPSPNSTPYQPQHFSASSTTSDIKASLRNIMSSYRRRIGCATPIPIRKRYSLRFKLYMAIILLDRDGRLRSGQPQGVVGPKSGDDATGGTDRSI